MKLRNPFNLLAVCFLFYCQSALSLGLGDARVHSFIGQSLEMRIELLTAPNDDLASVSARLASAEDFAMIGASREAISMPLFFSVREGEGGSGAYLLVTSRQPVNDPVLRLVVELNWSSGRLLREYTVFLDPPTVPAKAPEPDTARSEPPPEAAAERPAEPAEAPPPEPSPGREVAETAPPAAVADEVEPQASDETSAEPSLAEPNPDGGEYGPVRSGETLWRIASNYIGQANMDMNQVMLAIQRRNPDAFLNDNINLLKRGATLELPSASDVNEISRGRAHELVAQQEAVFRMRSSLAGSSTPLLAAESRVEPAASETVPDTGDSPQETLSRLEIVPASEEDLSAGQPGTGVVPGGEGSEEVERDLREELARSEEDLISERQQNEYLRERIDELEAQLAETERESDGLVADEEMANLEERLQAERLQVAEGADEAPIGAEEIDEAPGTIPAVTTSVPASDDRAWYSGATIWVIMSVIVIAGVVGWLIHRRRAEEYDLSAMAKGGTVATGLRGDAEEILRTLDADREEPSAEGAGAHKPASYRRGEAEDTVEFAAQGETAGDWRDQETAEGPEKRGEDDEDRPVVPLQRARRHREDDTDAQVLDENSSDPEIKLDLARAYISMGDKEAARAILDEVLGIGNKGQRSEAQSMMDEL